MTLKTAPSLRVKNAFPKLTEAAADINSASDELGKPIQEIEAIIKTLNLGVTVWHEMHGGRSPYDDAMWWSRDIGYAKIGGKWGIALRDCSGDSNCPDDDSVETWLFNDAPRHMRVSGAQHLADLIEKMVDEAHKMAEKIRAGSADAAEIAATLRELVPPAPKRK
jgi:hypothetical protein